MKRIVPFLLAVIVAQSAYPQCLAPSATATLDVNNVSARMNIGGSHWWDLQSLAAYEVPKGSGINSLFAGSVWIGAKDEDGNVRASAVRFRQVGIDFWPGPISQGGNISPNDCVDNDRIYKLNRWEVEEFIARNGQVGYVIPTDILEWPATGNPFAIADAGAPFFDANGDGVYNVFHGDYPAFAIQVPTDVDYHLLGDQCLWWVENDIGGPQTETGGEGLGVELQCMAYAYGTCDELNDQTFYRYTIVNRAGGNYTDTWLGVWVDVDLGFAQDDYVQCEVMRSLGFAYNGFAVDGTGGPQQYGEYPPAVGIGVLRGPLANPNDGEDNDRDGQIDETDEHHMMSRFVYHNNTGGGGNPAQTDPTTFVDYYNYMQGIWLDGEPMCYGGNGHPSSGCDVGTTARFMFPGDSDPWGFGTGGNPVPQWTEQTAGNVPFDRRFLLSSGPFDFSSGEIEYIHFGALWARDSSNINDPFTSAEKLFEVKDMCQEKFEGGFQDFECCPPQAEFTYQTFGQFGFHFTSIEEGNEYHWSYGDGSTGIGRFPIVHNYDDYGTYEVCLTVENACGSDTYCQTVTISPPPVGVRLKRIEGSGNMARYLEFKNGMHDTLFITGQSRIYHPIYEFNKGPVRIEVLDSTLLPQAEMFIALDGVADSSGWKMYPLGGTDTVYSSSTIAVGDQQLIPQWGLLAQVKQVDYIDEYCSHVLDCQIEQSNDPWLRFFSDTDFPGYSNWIRSGMVEDANNPEVSDYSGDYSECFEGILDGTWAPWKYVSHQDSMASPTWDKFKSLNRIENLASVDIVITPDQSKWTRCPVVEIADENLPSIGGARRFDLRHSPSVDKNGNPDGSSTMGMSWFPGYAVNLETGERLNMAFGENSWLQSNNGADMVWNPTTLEETPSGDPILGGGHYIYVFGHNGDEPTDDVPLYDEGEFIYDKLAENNFVPGDPSKRRVYKDAMWVAVPLLEDGHGLLESEVRIKLRVAKPYVDYLCLDNILNDTHPLYSFTTNEISTSISERSLDDNLFNVYPNPSSEFVYISNGSKEVIDRIELYDVTAHLLMKEYVRVSPSQRIQVDLQNLATGTYFLVIRSEDAAVVKKLVVN